MDPSDEAFAEISKIHADCEARILKFEKLVGKAITQESFDEYKLKSIEECQKRADSILLSSLNAGVVVQNNPVDQQNLENSESMVVENLKMELMFSKTMIDSLLAEKQQSHGLSASMSSLPHNLNSSKCNFEGSGHSNPVGTSSSSLGDNPTSDGSSSTSNPKSHKKKVVPKTASWCTEPTKMPKIKIQTSRRDTIRELLKSPELVHTIERHLAAISSENCERQEKLNGYQFIYDLLVEAAVPPMQVVQDCKVLDQLILMAMKQETTEEMMVSSMQLLVLFLRITEDSKKRTIVAIAERMLPHLGSLIAPTSTWGVQHNAIKILNSVAQDSEGHLQAVVAVKPVERLLNIVHHADADEDILKQIANTLVTLSSAVNLASEKHPAGLSVCDTILLLLTRKQHTMAAQGCDILWSVVTKSTPAGNMVSSYMLENLRKEGGILDFLLKIGIVDSTVPQTTIATNTRFHSLSSQENAVQPTVKVIHVSKAVHLSATRAFAAIFVRLPKRMAVHIFCENNIARKISAHLGALKGLAASRLTVEATVALEMILSRMKTDCSLWREWYDSEGSLSSFAMDLLKSYAYEPVTGSQILLKETALRVLDILFKSQIGQGVHLLSGCGWT